MRNITGLHRSGQCDPSMFNRVNSLHMSLSLLVLITIVEAKQAIWNDIFARAEILRPTTSMRSKDDLLASVQKNPDE